MLRNRQFAPLIVFIKAGSPDSVRKLHQNVVMQNTTKNKLQVPPPLLCVRLFVCVCLVCMYVYVCVCVCVLCVHVCVHVCTVRVCVCLIYCS